MSRGGFQIFNSFQQGEQPLVISSFQQQQLHGNFPAAGTQFREQPFPGYSESISSLALSKSRCYHSDHLLYFIIFLSLIKWLSIFSLYFWMICHTFFLCYCMSDVLLSLYIFDILVLYHLVCLSHTLRQSLERARQPPDLTLFSEVKYLVNALPVHLWLEFAVFQRYPRNGILQSPPSEHTPQPRTWLYIFLHCHLQRI